MLFMKKTILIFILSIAVIASFAQPQRGFQIWNKNEIKVQAVKNVFIDGAVKVHYSPERSAADMKYAELFLFHNPKKWFEYGGGFRVAEANLYPGWFQENRTMLIASFVGDYRKISFSFSNRFEYRSFENHFFHFRYKQDFKIKFPQLASWGMRFYLAEESFYKLNEIGLHLARFYGGLSAIQQEHFNLKMYYALEKYKLIEFWKTSDIVGLNMSFIF